MLRAVVSPGRTLRYEGRETTASRRLLFQVNKFTCKTKV